MLGKERIYATLEGKETDRIAVTPIFMAWAAKYIGKSYREYYLDGEVLAGAQLAAARDFGFDQVSAISDPFREAEGYGMEFDYPEHDVPRSKGYLIKSTEDAAYLKLLDIDRCGRMRQRIESVWLMAKEVGDSQSVLGWIEGPLAEYADLRGLERTLFDLTDTPEMFERACDVILENAYRFARAQIEAGADMIGVGDAACSLVGPGLYEQYILERHRELFARIHEAGARVKLHICGDITNLLGLIRQTGPDIVDIDSMVDLAGARETLGEEITLCGNIHPAEVILGGSVADVQNAARECIAKAGKRFILMAGCEIPPDSPVENVRAMRI